ncbi:QueT transporter family protein [Candidatus Bathyarchaeota archaeon A05DMB-2]|nr:QueT transporter family protein [Candidatus Bathyarchaeota archaeon A05DMB-2]
MLACVIGALPVGLIVGGYLWLFFPTPEILGAYPAWAGLIVSVTISSFVAIAVIGYLLLSTLSRPSILKPLKSHGLKVTPKNDPCHQRKSFRQQDTNPKSPISCDPSNKGGYNSQSRVQTFPT